MSNTMNQTVKAVSLVTGTEFEIELLEVETFDDINAQLNQADWSVGNEFTVSFIEELR